MSSNCALRVGLELEMNGLNFIIKENLTLSHIFVILLSNIY